jgi:hypothetical protein
MIDSFVLLGPILLLAVIVLLGFIGCEYNPPTAESEPIPGPNLRFTEGDKRVDLDWDPVADATEYHVKRGDVIGVHAPIGQPVIPPATSFPDLGLTNGKTFHYVVSAATLGPGALSAVETEDSNEVEATPLGPFVETFMGGTLRPGEDRWFGMAFLVIAEGVTVKKLGRNYLTGNSGVHQMVIVDGATEQVLGNTSVSATSEMLNGFRYGDVTPTGDFMPSGVPLQINHTYFVLSHEVQGGDAFLTQDTVVTATRPEATVTTGVESAGPTLVAFSTAGGPGHTNGPVNFQY